jgi:hypothetical protein
MAGDTVTLEILTYARGVNTATADAFAALRPILAAVVAGQTLTAAQALVLVAFCDHVVRQAADTCAVLDRYAGTVAGGETRH